MGFVILAALVAEPVSLAAPGGELPDNKSAHAARSLSFDGIPKVACMIARAALSNRLMTGRTPSLTLVSQGVVITFHTTEIKNVLRKRSRLHYDTPKGLAPHGPV